jgi:hypothetical protein
VLETPQICTTAMTYKAMKLNQKYKVPVAEYDDSQTTSNQTPEHNNQSKNYLREP